MNSYSPEKVINGTFGEVWLDDDYLAEVTGLEAKASLSKSEVKMAGKLVKGYKVTGIDCKGTLKANKATSRFIKMLSEDIKNGKTTPCTIITKLADPDSDGVERIQLDGVTFDELTLASWEVDKLLDESIPFTFTSWTVLDTI